MSTYSDLRLQPWLSSMQSACATVHCRLWPVWFCRIFSYYHTNGTILPKKKLLNKKCVLIFYTYLGWKIWHYKNSTKCYHRCINVFTYSTRYSYQISIKLPIYGNTFEKYSNIKFHKNPSNGSRFVPCGHKQERHGAANSLFFAILRTCLERSCGHA